MSSDFRMGIKNFIRTDKKPERVVLGDESEMNDLRNNNNQKELTDFSIKRILSDDHVKNKDVLKMKNLMSFDILDLSKNGTETIQNHFDYCQQSFAHDYNNLYQSKYLYSKTIHDKGNSQVTASSISVMKPKVHKLSSGVTNLNNRNLRSDWNWNCSDLYLNQQYHYHDQQKRYQMLLNKDYSENLVNVNESWMNVTKVLKLNDKFSISNPDIRSPMLSGNMEYIRPSLSELSYQKNIFDDGAEVSFKCQICEKVFGCSVTLESHIKTHKSPRYGCVECGKGFSQLRNYKYHLSVHRGTKEFAAECPECGKVFNDKGYLSSHMKIHRNKKEYECPYCPKSFNQRVAFNMHVRIHTGVKPHKCSECGKRFSRKMLLKQHMRTHSGEKPYQCNVCGKSFADRSNMTLHHRLHSGIKPFTCPICPKAFTKKHHLKTHLNYHTGCKPYVCPHPNCNQAFTQSSNMRTHAKKCQFKSPEIVSTTVSATMVGKKSSTSSSTTATIATTTFLTC